MSTLATDREPTTDDYLLSVTETAKRLSVHRMTVYRMIEEGRLRAVSLGRRRLIRPSELARFIRDLDDGGCDHE